MFEELGVTHSQGGKSFYVTRRGEAMGGRDVKK